MKQNGNDWTILCLLLEETKWVKSADATYAFSAQRLVFENKRLISLMDRLHNIPRGSLFSYCKTKMSQSVCSLGNPTVFSSVKGSHNIPFPLPYLSPQRDWIMYGDDVRITHVFCIETVCRSQKLYISPPPPPRLHPRRNQKVLPNY